MSLSPALQRFVLPPAAATLALLLQIGATQAQTSPTPQPPAGGGRRLEQLQNLTDSQKQELFNARRSIGLRTYPAQIAILQKGERCLNTARDLPALSACRKEEWTARRELMGRNREELRTVYQRLGVPLPERKGPAGPGGGGRRGQWGEPGQKL